MRNRRKRDRKVEKSRLCGFLMMLMLLLVCTAQVRAEGNGRVYDQAGLLTGTEREELEAQAKELEENTGYDFFVVTTDDAEGKEAVDYAEDFYMDHKSTINGVIYLIDMDNREIYIATSGDMRYRLNDDRIERMLDDAYDRVSEEEYAKGFEVMLQDTKQYLKEGIEDGTFTVDVETGEIVYYEKPKSITPVEALIALAAGVIAGGAVFGAIAGKYKLKWGRYAYSYRDNSSVVLQKQNDIFVNRVVTQRRIPKDPPHSSGGGGGGHSSSVHTGSGGNSFGGGGKKF